MYSTNKRCILEFYIYFDQRMECILMIISDSKKMKLLCILIVSFYYISHGIAQQTAHNSCIGFDLSLWKTTLSKEDKKLLSTWYNTEIQKLKRCRVILGDERQKKLKADGITLAFTQINAYLARRMMRNTTVKPYITAYAVPKKTGGSQIGIALDSEERKGPDLGAGAWIAFHKKDTTQDLSVALIKTTLSELIAKLDNPKLDDYKFKNDKGSPATHTLSDHKSAGHKGTDHKHTTHKVTDQKAIDAKLAIMPLKAPKRPKKRFTLPITKENKDRDLLFLFLQNKTHINKEYNKIGQLKLGSNLGDFTGDNKWSTTQLHDGSFVCLRRRFYKEKPPVLFGEKLFELVVYFVDQKLVKVEIAFELTEKYEYVPKKGRTILKNFVATYDKLKFPRLKASVVYEEKEAFESIMQIRRMILRKYNVKLNRGLWENKQYAVHLDRTPKQEYHDEYHPNYKMRVLQPTLKLNIMERSQKKKLAQKYIDLTQQWYETMYNMKYEKNSNRIRWVKISGGSFMMGSNQGLDDEKPIHKVTLKPFEISQTEVTVGQYRKCVEAGVCTKPDTFKSCNWGQFGREHQPINCVDWGQARTFAKWVGADLPTEAEWEYAARGGGLDRKYPWGNMEVNCNYAITAIGGYGCGRRHMWEVCSLPRGATFQGLCDMIGNVTEWTRDEYRKSYKEAPTDGNTAVGTLPACDPVCKTGTPKRVTRGGGWGNYRLKYLRTTFRDYADATFRGNVIGFRIRRDSK